LFTGISDKNHAETDKVAWSAGGWAAWSSRELSCLEERTVPPTGPEGRYCSYRKTDLQRLLIPPSMAPVAQGDCVADALPSSAEHVGRVDLQDGPVVLVGHSWGGQVITEAGTHDKVKALVYENWII